MNGYACVQDSAGGLMHQAPVSHGAGLVHTFSAPLGAVACSRGVMSGHAQAQLHFFTCFVACPFVVCVT
jgi:hypothetical protein